MVAVCVWVMVGTPATATPPEEPIGALPVVLHVATRNGAPVLDAGEIAERVALANRHFGAFGICFEVSAEEQLPEEHAVVETIRERHVFRRMVEPEAIHVFIVGEMIDEVPSAATRRAAARVGREPSGRISGANIPLGQRARGTYLLVSAQGTTLTLTHELGHFLGAPHHRDPLNIMSYGADRQRFDEAQGQTFRRTARRFLRARTLRPVAQCGTGGPSQNG